MERVLLPSKGPQIVVKLCEAFAKEGQLWKEWHRGVSSLSQPDAALKKRVRISRVGFFCTSPEAKTSDCRK